ncbi:MAG: DMT family transporter [Gemmatimonadota bacterium]
MSESARRRGVVPVLAIAIFGVSSGAVLVRLAEAPASAIAVWRPGLSLLVCVPLLLVSGQWRTLSRLNRRDFLWLLASGSFLALHFVLWFRSLELTSVASSTVLVTTHPLFVGLLSGLLLREPPARAEWIGILVAVGGATLIGLGDFGLGDSGAGEDPLQGDILALVAGFLAALYFIAGRRLRAKLGLWAYVTPVYAVAALVAVVIASAGGVPLTGFDGETWLALAGLALGPMLLGHTGFNWALKHVRAYVVSVTGLLEPIGATVLALLILGSAELPSWATFLGGLLVLAGVWLPLRARAGKSRSMRE